MVWKIKRYQGVFNIGTGEARTFNDLVNSVYKSLNKNVNVDILKCRGCEEPISIPYPS